MDRFPVDLSARPVYQDGYSPIPGGHRGIDIFAPSGTKIFAGMNGIARADEDPKGGHVIYLSNPNDDIRYYYAHLDSRVGDFPRTVHAGDVIGTIGTSGNAAGKAPHLHFQMWWKPVGVVNPYPHLKRAEIADSAPKPPPAAPSEKPPEDDGSGWQWPPWLTPSAPHIPGLPSAEQLETAATVGVGILALGLLWLLSRSERRYG